MAEMGHVSFSFIRACLRQSLWHSESYFVGPVRKVEALLNALYQSPTLCTWRSEMGVLLTFSKFWNSEGDKERLSETSHCGFNVCREVRSLDL